MEVLFDPGYAKHTTILSISIQYLYANINRFKNLGQRKNQFKLHYQGILKIVNNNVAFCLGSILWALYIKSLGNVTISQNPCLGTTYDKDETLEEVIYSKNYFEQLKKDAKYYLGLDYNIDPKYLEILDIYGEFLTINEGFVNTKTTDDIKLPAKIKQPKDIEKIHKKILEVVKNGNLPDLFEFYGQIV